MTNWTDTFKRNAALVAFPGIELKDTDKIEVTSYASEGYYYSEYTYDTGSFEIAVSVYRDGATWKYKEFNFEDAQRFFVALMNYKEDA